MLGCSIIESKAIKRYLQHVARSPATMFSLILLQRSRYELWRGFGSDGYLYDFVKKSYNLLDQADMQAMFDASVHCTLLGNYSLSHTISMEEGQYGCKISYHPLPDQFLLYCAH